MTTKIIIPQNTAYQKILGRVKEAGKQGAGNCAYCAPRCLSCGKSSKLRERKRS